MDEIKRISNVNMEDILVYEIECIGCRSAIQLHYNGGELDFRECCGHRYELECVQIDFVVSEEQK